MKAKIFKRIDYYFDLIKEGKIESSYIKRINNGNTYIYVNEYKAHKVQSIYVELNKSVKLQQIIKGDIKIITYCNANDEISTLYIVNDNDDLILSLTNTIFKKMNIVFMK